MNIEKFAFYDVRADERGTTQPKMASASAKDRPHESKNVPASAGNSPSSSSRWSTAIAAAASSDAAMPTANVSRLAPSTAQSSHAGTLAA